MITTDNQVDEQIAGFARAVRDELSDLPTDDVDELVDGLAADLTDQAADRGADFQLANPAAYAAELRAAAGLPERPAKASVRRLSAAEYGRGLRVLIMRSFRSSPMGRWVLDTVIALRPVWWVARGWALFGLLAPLVGADSDIVGFPGNNVGGWILLGVLLLLSIQWGQGHWAPTKWLKAVRIIVSIVTVIALPIQIALAASTVHNAITYTESVQTSVIPGLAIDGERVRNIFAYTLDGEPIEAVQLFDQNGQPLTTTGNQTDTNAHWDESLLGTDNPIAVPFTGRDGRSVWNIFPMGEMPAGSWQGTYDPNISTATTPAYPFVRAPAHSEPATRSPTPTP